nr:hypothetical protein [Kibdelosporangium sp. MJ126-NF4]CTQ98570.1 hypothetical protein [Kibdelosporangium sp. MJ126-NF4]
MDLHDTHALTMAGSPSSLTTHSDFRSTSGPPSSVPPSAGMRVLRKSFMALASSQVCEGDVRQRRGAP